MHGRSGVWNRRPEAVRRGRARRGKRCLDAGCGPGEAIRLMAERVGPSGSVTGIDVDAALGEAAIAMLRAHGHRQCHFECADVTTDTRRWRERSLTSSTHDCCSITFPSASRCCVACGTPSRQAGASWSRTTTSAARTSCPLETVEEFKRLVVDAFSAAGCDVHVGARLPELFAEAGIGTPDGTDVAGRLDRLADAQSLFTGVYSGCSRPRSRTVAPARATPPSGGLSSPATSSASPIVRRCGRC